MSQVFHNAALSQHQQWIVGAADGVQLKLADARIVGEAVEEVNLIGAELERCTLANVSFKRVDLNGLILRHCSLIDCVFEECMIQDTNMRECDLTRVSLIGAWMGSLLAPKSRFEHVDFSSANLVKADFANSRFEDCRFDHAKLKRTNFTNCHMPRCSFRAANAERAFFRRTHLVGADFSDLMLDHTYFINCALHGIRGKPQRPEEARIDHADYSERGDGSLIVTEERVRADWSSVDLA